MAKSADKKLEEKIILKKESAWKDVSEAEKKKVFKFCDSYKDFLSRCKTEREAVKFIVSRLEKAGFKEISSRSKLKTGDKVFKNIKGKSVVAAIIGKDNTHFHMIGSHIDSPRLDLKPYPLMEDLNLALLKSHYYGGIKKYHWVNVPLAMHGVIFTKKGKKIEFSIGEKPSEEKFIIPDLLPHLSRDQMEKKPNKIVEGEQLNIIVGNIPVKDKDIEQKVKFAVMKHLHKRYGITEEDFLAAEIEFVPANKPSDIGFDNSMIAAYGQDDKVCAYTSLIAFLTSKPKRTAVALFVDKEEIGSVGDTGAASRLVYNFLKELADKLNIKDHIRLIENSNALSADVTAAFDPNFKDTHDPANASVLGGGVCVEKYGGGGGKYTSNDASAEYIAFVRKILDKHNIRWQSGELGKIDLGGGGTIAMFLSKYGMNCVDTGPAVLGMHSPYELTSKVDVYLAFKFYKAFFES